jgi:metallo-beta-lactamase class B
MTCSRTLCALILALAWLPRPAAAQLAERWQRMNQPVEPLRIAGPLYYVGANSVTAFLITTPAGHILIDGGFDETVPLIRSGVEALGFQWKDVRLLLNSHAHFDHAGGLARIQQETGARFAASEQDAPLLERGGLGDDLLGDEAPFTPVRVDQRLKDGESVSLGGVTLTARVTAGHTRGCTSWDFEVEDAGERRRVVSICSLSVLDGMRFLEDPTYPGIADDFRRSFEVLEAIPADVFLGSHAGFFDLEGKRERLGQPGPNPFVDPQGYRAYVETARKRFDAALEAERAAQE